MAKAVPDGFNTVSAYLIVKNAEKALDFYQRAFGAEAGERMTGPDGTGTMHAEMRIGDSTVMLTDENPAWELKSPQTLGGCTASLHLYVEDVDKAFQRAVNAGCTVKAPLMDAFWGDRYGKLEDPFGHTWGLATHVEDVPHGEVKKRAEAFFASMGGGCQE